MPNMTVEQQIVDRFQCPVPEVLQDLADQGLTSKEVAQRLECGVSNVRRIARKYQIRFNQPIKQSELLQNEEFLAEEINPVNFLSRVWDAAKVPKRQAAVA